MKYFFALCIFCAALFATYSGESNKSGPEAAKPSKMATAEVLRDAIPPTPFYVEKGAVVESGGKKWLRLDAVTYVTPYGRKCPVQVTFVGSGSSAVASLITYFSPSDEACKLPEVADVSVGYAQVVGFRKLTPEMLGGGK